MDLAKPSCQAVAQALVEMSKESVRAQLLEGFARVDSTGARNCHLTRNEFARLCSLLDSKLTEDKVQASLEAVGYSSGTDQLHPDDLVNWMFDGTPIPAKATASTAVAPAKAKAQVRPSTATLRQEAKQILLGAADNGSLESALKSTSTTKERPLSATLLSAAVGAASMEQEANSEEPFQLVEQFQFVQEVDIEEVKLRAQRALASAMAMEGEEQQEGDEPIAARGVVIDDAALAAEATVPSRPTSPSSPFFDFAVAESNRMIESVAAQSKQDLEEIKAAAAATQQEIHSMRDEIKQETAAVKEEMVSVHKDMDELRNTATEIKTVHQELLDFVKTMHKPS